MRLTLNAAETGHLVLATMHSANCAEALSRLCMSFPSDIQGSVRAQLADVLVGVSCQRLEFLTEHRLRVPRCEILLPSSGAKGTIRAGNFSQIANVLQAGGDDGMWTYDRYQRWIEQVNDWVRPSSVTRRTATAAESAAAASAAGLKAAMKGPARPSRPEAAAARATLPKSTPLSAPVDEVIDVPAEDMDLSQLAELAKKVVERKP
jgi:twitching motility protein PilT